MDKYIGRLLDNRYEILEVIGTGGMAVVYKARCHRLNRLVAIKILKDDFLEDEEFRRRFHSESQAVAMLSHPNIVSIYDVSTSISADYIVMELIDGITLKQYMEKKGVLNWKETLHFAIQIAKALEHAHSRGIVHRDIKPHNVMVLKNGSVKVTDFGIARMMSKGNTLTKEALGSVHYISPEQAKGGRVDNRSDIYSLGVVMYEMMSGRPPYDGESPVAVAIQHINGGAAMPSTLNPNIPGGLEQIIMKAMAHEPADRYTTATLMLRDLDEFRKSPAMLFDYNTPPLDEVTKLPKPPLVLETPSRPSTAERVASAKSGEHRPPNPQRRRPPSNPDRGSKQPPRQRKREEEESRSNVATIAIIACSVVMVIAVAVFLFVLLSGGTGAKPTLIDVPNLVGKVYKDLPNYADFEIKIDREVHDNDYEAGQIIDQNPKAGDQIEKNNSNAIYVTVSLGKAVEIVHMPDVTDWELSQAERSLLNLNLNLHINVERENHDTVVAGNVIRTEPAAQTELSVGQEVTLYVSEGVQIKTVSMPDVTGDKEESAKKVLNSQELDLEIKVEEEYDSVVAAGDVIRTDPEKGASLKTGQKVTLYVSKGPKLVAVKNIIGLSVDRAVSILNDDEFTNYELEPVESDAEKETVIEMKIGQQVVNPGDKIDVNARLVLYVSKGPASAPTVTKDVVLDLKGAANEGSCRVQVKCGNAVVFDETVEQGTASVTIKDQTGSGLVYYEVIIEDMEAWIEKVPFE